MMFKTLSRGDPWEGKFVRLVNNGAPEIFLPIDTATESSNSRYQSNSYLEHHGRYPWVYQK